jgi:phytoene dehydrogenase-like protein
VIGNFADPYQAGTAYVLLHHAFGEVKGKAGAWGIARGGMGAISDAIAASRAARRADRDRCSGRQDPRRATSPAGVVTEDGREFHARTIAANLHPQLLLTKLLDRAGPATRTSGASMPTAAIRRPSA